MSIEYSSVGPRLQTVALAGFQGVYQFFGRNLPHLLEFQRNQGRMERFERRVRLCFGHIPPFAGQLRERYHTG